MQAVAVAVHILAHMVWVVLVGVVMAAKIHHKAAQHQQRVQPTQAVAVAVAHKQAEPQAVAVS